jgi:hypothetical protein
MQTGGDKGAHDSDPFFREMSGMRRVVFHSAYRYAEALTAAGTIT